MNAQFKTTYMDDFFVLLKKLSDNELYDFYNIVASFYYSRHTHTEKNREQTYPKRFIDDDKLPVWELGFTERFDREACYDE